MITTLEIYLAHTEHEPKEWPIPVKKEDIKKTIEYITSLEKRIMTYQENWSKLIDNRLFDYPYEGTFDGS